MGQNKFTMEKITVVPIYPPWPGQLESSQTCYVHLYPQLMTFFNSLLKFVLYKMGAIWALWPRNFKSSLADHFWKRATNVPNVKTTETCQVFKSDQFTEKAESTHSHCSAKCTPEKRDVWFYRECASARSKGCFRRENDEQGAGSLWIRKYSDHSA